MREHPPPSKPILLLQRKSGLGLILRPFGPISNPLRQAGSHFSKWGSEPVLLHLVLALPLLVQQQPGDPVAIWRSKTDPFTDKYGLVLRGLGEAGEVHLAASCRLRNGIERYSFSFNFDSEMTFPLTDEGVSKFVGRGLGYFRFDNGSVETFHFLSFANRMALNFSHKDGKMVTSDEGDAFARRLADHDRLRIDLRENSKEFRRVIEDFDISRVSFETLARLCRCAHTPSSCVEPSEP